MPASGDSSLLFVRYLGEAFHPVPPAGCVTGRTGRPSDGGPRRDDHRHGRASMVARASMRHQVIATDTPVGHGSIQYLEARHRAHARVEDRIRTGKDTGFGRFPSATSPSTRP